MSLSQEKCSFVTATVVKFFCLLLLVMHVSPQTSTLSPVETVNNTTCVAGSNLCPTTSKDSSSTTLEPKELGPTENTTTPVDFPSSAEVTTVRPENVTTKSSSAATSSTSSPPTTTVKPPPSSTSQPPEEDATPTGGQCFCDMMAYSCDINCCCDPDCSKFQRRTFSHCQNSQNIAYDDRYCYATKLVFLNNTEHILQQTNTGAFCIVRSNLIGSALYPSKPAVTSVQSFNHQWEQSHTTIWPEIFTLEQPPLDKWQSYVAGDKLLVLWNNQVQHLDLPSCGLTFACSVQKSVLYLKPVSTHCVQKAPSNQFECEALSVLHYQRMLRIIRSPLALNNSELLSKPTLKCSPEVCAPVTIHACSDPLHQNNGGYTCNELTNPESVFSFNDKTGVCQGVIKQLQYVVYHNGSQGISHISAFIWLTNTSVGESSKPVYQKFSVEFNWKMQNESSTPSSSITSATIKNSSEELSYPRSGNPGYIVGKPVPVGLIFKQTTADSMKERNVKSGKESFEETVIKLSRDPNDWLSVPSPDKRGQCNTDYGGGIRHLVAFGEDIHLSCSVPITYANISSSSACSDLRKNLVHLLLGRLATEFFNSSQPSEWNRVVPAFGDANVAMRENWIPLLVENAPQFPILHPSTQAPSSASKEAKPVQDIAQLALLALGPPLAGARTPVCMDIPQGMQIRILYGLVGESSSPQAKIFGASLRFMPLHDITPTCVSESCEVNNIQLQPLRIVSSTVFIDVSSPAVTRFAEPPAIHIRLPPDFFYPFMSLSESCALPSCSVSLSLFTICVSYVLTGLIPMCNVT